MLSIILLFACEEEPRTVTDHEHYLNAVEASDPMKALKKCQSISKESLKGECILFSAKSAVENRMDGLGFCESAPTEAWRSACLFEVADISGATGQKADQICRQTGPFARRCFYHALQREENALMAKYPIGKEMQMIEGIQHRITTMDIEELKEDPLSETLCSRIIAKRFLKTWKKLKTTPYRYTACGNAPKSVCEAGYRFILKQRIKDGIRTDCSTAISSERAVELGFPSWENAMESAVSREWENLCKQLSGQNQKAPDHQESQAN